LDFGALGIGARVTLQLAINNAGGQPLHWQVDTSKFPWFTIDAPSQTIDFQTPAATINVTLNTSSLKPGKYQNTLSFTSDGGNKDVLITFEVTNKQEAKLSVTPNKLNFNTLKPGQ